MSEQPGCGDQLPCAACRERGKTWAGGDPVCSFPNGGPFAAEGWNCATASLIRDLCRGGSNYHDETHPKVDKRWIDDQWYATIEIDDVELDSGSAYALWVTWYKNRGRTEAMWLLDGDTDPRRPTEADCRVICAALSQSASA